MVQQHSLLYYQQKLALVLRPLPSQNLLGFCTLTGVCSELLAGAMGFRAKPVSLSRPYSGISLTHYFISLKISLTVPLLHCICLQPQTGRGAEAYIGMSYIYVFQLVLVYKSCFLRSVPQVAIYLVQVGIRQCLPYIYCVFDYMA